MKIAIVMVSSINGKITNGDNPNIYSWTSPEDQKHFFSLLGKSSLVVMGSKTYEQARDKMDLTQEKLRIVLTRNPEKYSQEIIAGKLEFSNESPAVLVHRLEKTHKKMLVVGGGEINRLFFQSGLVDELFLTIEPIMFGTGKPLVQEIFPQTRMKLLSIQQLNKQGTLLLHYRGDK